MAIPGQGVTAQYRFAVSLEHDLTRGAISQRHCFTPQSNFSPINSICEETFRSVYFPLGLRSYWKDYNIVKELSCISTKRQPANSVCFIAEDFQIKLAEHSFGSFWVYSFAKSWQEKGCSSQAELASEKYTDEKFWLTGKMWRFRSFYGNMNDWIQP